MSMLWRNHIVSRTHSFGCTSTALMTYYLWWRQDISYDGDKMIIVSILIISYNMILISAWVPHIFGPTFSAKVPTIDHLYCICLPWAWSFLNTYSCTCTWLPPAEPMHGFLDNLSYTDPWLMPALALPPGCFNAQRIMSARFSFPPDLIISPECMDLMTQVTVCFIKW